jgi:hypothetical protein
MYICVYIWRREVLRLRFVIEKRREKRREERREERKKRRENREERREKEIERILTIFNLD